MLWCRHERLSEAVFGAALRAIARGPLLLCVCLSHHGLLAPWSPIFPRCVLWTKFSFALRKPRPTSQTGRVPTNLCAPHIPNPSSRKIFPKMRVGWKWKIFPKMRERIHFRSKNKFESSRTSTPTTRWGDTQHDGPAPKRFLTA